MGEKSEKNFYKKHTYIASKKRWKKVWKKCENTFFYKQTNIVTKNGGKKREKIFYRNTRTSRFINYGKKSSGKCAKQRFF